MSALQSFSEFVAISRGRFFLDKCSSAYVGICSVFHWDDLESGQKGH